MDEYIVSDLPDVSGWTLAELLDCDDPVLLAAMERVVESAVRREPVDGCGC